MKNQVTQTSKNLLNTRLFDKLIKRLEVKDYCVDDTYFFASANFDGVNLEFYFDSESTDALNIEVYNSEEGFCLSAEMILKVNNWVDVFEQSVKKEKQEIKHLESTYETLKY